MNSSVKFLSPIVIGGLPLPGCSAACVLVEPPALELPPPSSSSPPQPATTSASAASAAISASSRFLRLPDMCPPRVWTVPRRDRRGSELVRIVLVLRLEALVGAEVRVLGHVGRVAARGRGAADRL